MTITNNIPASSAGSNDASGTVQVHATGVSIYNVNIANTYGKVRVHSCRSRLPSPCLAGDSLTRRRVCMCSAPYHTPAWGLTARRPGTSERSGTLNVRAELPSSPRLSRSACRPTSSRATGASSQATSKALAHKIVCLSKRLTFRVCRDTLLANVGK